MNYFDELASDSISHVVEANLDEFTGEVDTYNAEYDLVKIIEQEVDCKVQEILGRLPKIFY